MNQPQLKRIRWGVRAVLTLGVAASVVANVLHANPNPISQSIAAWPPLALLITIELISRVPIHRRYLAVARFFGTATIAGIAAWVSYWHMAGVASRYGEVGAAPYLIPFSVDGLVVVASVCLVELAGRIREGEDTAPAAQPAVEEKPLPAPTAPVFLEPVTATPEPFVEPASVAAEPDESAGQRVRQDDRSSQEIDLLVRAIRDSNPRMPQRQIAVLAQVSETTVRRALKRTQPVEESQPERVNGHVPELDSVPV
jgi:hypothetical protein